MVSIEENDRRKARLQVHYNPLTGEGSTGERVKIHIPDYDIPIQYVPRKMIEDVPEISRIEDFGGMKPYLTATIGFSEQNLSLLQQEIFKVRCQYDFEFWAVSCAIVKDKKTSNDIPFKINRAQQKLLSVLEKQRCEGKPIRVILLKARQWGGSTLVQIYMAWIQLVHKKNWNSVICAHLKDASYNIRGMYTKLLSNYPPFLVGKDTPLEFKGYEKSQSTSQIPERGCKIIIGSAESPDSVRSADVNMAHLSEVAFWPNTKSNTPMLLVRSICSSILSLPYTMVVLESTANGVGDYFHSEYIAAKAGNSDKEAVFVAWFESDLYTADIPDYEEFIQSMSHYETHLFNLGATLESIAWYREKRKEYRDHESMMAEFPSDEIEAFTSTGRPVFDKYKIADLRKRCIVSPQRGEIVGAGNFGKDCLRNIQFSQDEGGELLVWEDPSPEEITKRYVVVVDIGGRSDKADYSVIAVLDRKPMMFGLEPDIVAQWRGHIDHDLLVWKSAQIATWYNKATLVIESNTLETETDGDHTDYILDLLGDVYSNLYARADPTRLKEGLPARWGFHTNRSTKTTIIDNLVRVLRTGGYGEKDIEACDEMDVYERKQNGSFGAKDGYHDDILMTRAIGLYVCGEIGLPKLIEKRQRTQRFIVSEASI